MDYRAVTAAMNAGTPTDLICAACPWDRLCISPPMMTTAEVQETVKKATDEAKLQNPQTAGTTALMASLMFAGRDTAAEMCPVFALRLRSPEGRGLADQVRAMMRSMPG